jgi:hypothetical protein
MKPSYQYSTIAISGGASESGPLKTVWFCWDGLYGPGIGLVATIAVLTRNRTIGYGKVQDGSL